MRLQELGKVKVINQSLMIEAAMSPNILSELLDKQLRKIGIIPKGFILCYLHRICWPLNTILQINEGLPMSPEITGHDTIVMSYENAFERISFAFLDMGIECLPLCSFIDNEVGLSESYENSKASFIAVPQTQDWKSIAKKLSEIPLIDKEKLIAEYKESKKIENETV
jgi:hypothetical protein